jgi:mono/diheme cytochrome c family protein
MKDAVICLFVVAGLWGCSRDEHNHPNLRTGEQLYNHHCAECHGEDGTGHLFDVIPANILTKKSPREIMVYITTDGHHERKMPVFRTMQVAEARLITEHLLSLKTRYENAAHPMPRELMIEP